MRTSLTMHQLQAFVEVARVCSFRQAAEALRISQPALSRTIQGAEDALGTRLFDRDTRNVRVTPSGNELLPIARRVLSEFESSLGELAQFLDGRRGRVVVATLPSLGMAFLPEALAAYAKFQPAVEFSIHVLTTRPLLEMVNSGDADFAIGLQPPPDGRFRYDHLVDDEFALVCAEGHPLASKASWNWKVFSQYPLIAQSSSTSMRQLTDGVFQKLGLSVRMGYECGSLPLTGRLVAANLGIAALPRLTLPQLGTAGLAVRGLRGPVLERQLGIITRAGRSLSTASRNFLQLLKMHVRAVPPQRENRSHAAT